MNDDELRRELEQMAAAQPYVDVDGGRRAVAHRVRARRWRRQVGFAVVALGTAAAITAVTLAAVSRPGRSVVATGAPTTLDAAIRRNAVPITIVPTTSTAVVAPPVTTTTATTAPATTVTGTVLGSDGAPAAGAYVIGLHSLTVARTDSAGHFSIACKHEALAASSWLLPVQRPNPGGVAYGRDTTNYDALPSSPGDGYVLSGGSGSVGAAKAIPCGQVTDFRLPAGATVDIALQNADGSPLAAGSASPPPDNLYVPLLGANAALETAAVDSSGHQHLTRLAAGTLRIDGVSTTWNCSGQGVTPDPSIAGATVAVAAGRTVQVVCRAG